MTCLCIRNMMNCLPFDFSEGMMACSLLPLPLRPSPPPNSYHFSSHQHHLIALCFSRSRPYYHYSQSQQEGRRLLLNNNKSNDLLFFGPSIHPSLAHYPFKPYPAPGTALDSDAPRPTHQVLLCTSPSPKICFILYFFFLLLMMI